MEWVVNTSAEFEAWFDGLDDEVRRRLAPRIDRLVLHGPTLGYPESSDISGSKHGGLRELRIQVNSRPYRVLYAFDPNREALLLLGDDKGGEDAWYDINVPVADTIFAAHLAAIAKARVEQAKRVAEQASGKGTKGIGTTKRKKRDR